MNDLTTMEIDMKLRNILNAFLLGSALLFTGSAFCDTAPVKDSVITAKIKSKIALDKSLSVFNVDVTTEHGVVTLSGNVDSDTDASAAIELAQSTDGVSDVEAGKLVVKESKHPFSDTAITAKIKGKYIKEKLFGKKDVAAMAISVETNDGVVSLSGDADSQQQADNAVKIAKSVSGVKNVESRIEVKK
jgi:hyperosmotically inducible protein